MKNHFRRVSLIAICLVLAVILIACAVPTSPPDPPATPPFSPAPAANPSALESAEEEVSREESMGRMVANDHVVVEVIVRGTPFSMDEFVSVYVQIANVGEDTLSFIHGSGSNTVPDALQINVGDLVGIYRPGIMTMDFQTHTLNPGDMLEFDIGFAPYTSNVDFAFIPFMTSDEADIEFFEDNEDFSPAIPGIFEGEVSFSYVVHDSNGEELVALFITDEDDIQTVSIGFTIVIE